ncbi:glycosyltransferase [Aquimarina brevivitae]|uniref:Glycosyltransferase involved in cell wall biosynthesis n=1 Tax=Aquimarina brevivitae TaxID=323412 RepID=A0A4Q7PM72_9FLAO|nr:glycosyltransferase [Aquimarina brevivitae]RZT00093.1 glycosyltransferase involved in cell wall biosynthesis [Aquimarina brevivitae]
MATNVLIIGTVWPEPTSSAAGMRMLQLISTLQENKCNITFASTSTKTPQRFNLKALGVAEDIIQVNDKSFDSYIKHVAPQIVIFDRFMMEEQFGWRVAKQCPEAIKILNTEDLHCLRTTRAHSIQQNIPFSPSLLLQQDITKREIASILRSDLSLIISSFEMELLVKLFNIPPDLLCYFPFVFERLTSKDTQRWIPFSQRNHFVTIGNFRHQPNWDSFMYLKEAIWPLIRKELPTAELHIYGAYMPPKATQYHKPKEGFFMKGWTEDAKNTLSLAKVCLAPLRFGAGIKGKLAEAMLTGTPSVTTPIGAEGMLDDDLDWNGFTCNTAEEIAAAAIRLYNDERLWNQCQQNGIAIVNSLFTADKLKNTLLASIDKLRKNLTQHRSKNFIGSILNFHTLRSTEYMSRWIEEKNKNT